MAKTDINSVTTIGNLTRDMELSYTPNGTAIGNLSIAVNRSRKSGDQWLDEVSYFEVRTWGKTAENLKQYLTKGKKIAVNGFLKQDRWEKDGQKYSKIYIVANDINLLSFDNNNSNNNTQYYQPPVQNAVQQSVNTVPANAPGEFPEDIPF